EMGETRARYGGVIVKKTQEKGEEMKIEVVDWKNLITDQVDIKKGVIIERHYLTPAELQAKDGVWSNVDEALSLYSKKGYTRADERIEVWEVHGEFPESYLSDEAETEDNEDYGNQVHYFCVKGAKQVHLYWAEEAEKPYKYLPWKRVSGRALGRGVVEEGNESQVWTNDAVMKEQSYMEWASKIFLKTNSKKIGNNASTDHENGDIFVLEDNKDVSVLNLTTGIQPKFQEMLDKWWSQYERVTSSYDAVRGETPPSGQPYRLQALVSQSGSSHFDYRREEWGIFLKELFYDWVFPYIQKKLTKQHILASDFSPEELKKIDESFANHEANKHVMDRILSGEVVTIEEYEMVKQQYLGFLSQKNGKRRFLDVPDNYYKDMKSKLSINITGEQKNKQAIMESLTNILQQMIPMVQMGIATPEDVKLILNRITEVSGVGLSPMSLSKGGQQAQQGMMQGPTPQSQQQAQPLGQAGIQSVRPQATQ
ncbi:MAG: hypothetical protein NUW00_00980, partial [Candidatus Kaiserbacteria bacterium]|nr:hypothetical protein [Candidatus Kaiserbacteria bacterium]